MTDLVITEIGDAWINGTSGRTSNNYGSTNFVQVESGVRRALLLPELGNISGRTIVDAYLVGHSRGTAAQTLTVVPVAEKWQPGRVKWGTTGGPAVTSAAAVAAAIPAAVDGQAVTVPGLAAIIQAVADGTDWYGLRVSTSATSRQQFYATESGSPAWELHVTISDITDPPSSLRPAGGAVSTSRPILSWTAPFQVARRIQVDTPAVGVDPDEVAPDFDTGMVVSVDPSFDLAASSHTPAGAGPHYWRVQVEAEGDDVAPVWSDWAEFTVSALPTLVIDSPTGPFGDPSPTLLAHLSSGTLAHWKAMVTGPSRADVRARTGLQTGPIAWNIPHRNNGREVIEDGGWIHIEAADTVDRAITVGQSGTISVWVPIQFAPSDTVTPPTNLRVTQLPDGDPRHIWTWARTEAADAWVLTIDGKNVQIITADDVTFSSGIYTWQDHGEIPGLRQHTLGVQALEGSEVSVAATVAHTSTAEGVWLLPDDTDPIHLDGTAVSGFTNVGRYATYQPVIGPPVEVIYDPNPGRVGTFTGTISDFRQDVWATLDAIEALRGSRTRRARLVWGSQSIRVRVIDPDATSADDIQPNTLRHVVRFDFVEVGD